MFCHRLFSAVSWRFSDLVYISGWILLLARLFEAVQLHSLLLTAHVKRSDWTLAYLRDRGELKQGTVLVAKMQNNQNQESSPPWKSQSLLNSIKVVIFLVLCWVSVCPWYQKPKQINTYYWKPNKWVKPHCIFRCHPQFDLLILWFVLSIRTGVAWM